MKHTLRLLPLFLILIATKSQSQVTRLSNNTNIRFGIPLGNIGILADSTGSLWKTDGTAAGTVQYTSKVNVDSTFAVAVFNNKIYFSGVSSEGYELWSTDGTDAGTQLVKDIRAGVGSSAPRQLTIYNNALYFFASTANEGIELWKSDGTGAGTVLLKDINVGTESSFNANQTFFNLSNNILYFDATDGVTGTELWKTDGSTAGTVLVKDINPGTSSSNPTGFTTMGSNVYFSANDGAHGTELWKSDGTDAGTALVQDIASGGTGSSPQQFVVFQNKLFFLVSTGFIPSYNLFSSDGTDAGTVLVKSFGTGAFPIISLSVIINNKLYFSNFAVTNGLELWATDGTTNGTKIFKDINPGSASSNAFILPNFSSLYSGGSGDFHNALFNGKIFFMADDGTNGLELWITDGTDGGTVMVKDINPGTGSSLLEDGLSWFYTSTGLYFAGDNGTSGTELFFSDGTEGNTEMVSDINAGGNSSVPVLFMFLNNHLYCTADDGDGGGDRDLYIIDEDVVLPVAMLNFTATLAGKSVDLNWSTATESNTRNFVVQRSYDGVNFRHIGTVNAAGNSVNKKDYSFIDASALNGSATIYYRLQVVDKDGKTSNSKIAMVHITASGAIVTLYPNPVKDRLNFVTSNTLTNVQLRITDKSGKIVLAQKITTVQAGQQNTINVSALARGSYYLQLISGNNKQTTQFIKF